jgi:SAM-dependent methyltransferase
VFGCRVEGIDSSADFVESARELASQTGLDERVRFDQGHVCHLPYRAGHFDVVWTQHVSMNVADRVRLYGEIARVLRPGGIFAAFEPVATDRSPPDFPLPWARTPQSSFLVTETRMRELILATEAFDVISWRERSGPDLGWMAARERSQISTNRLIPTALAAVLGADFPLMLRNFIDALDSRRVALVQAVLRRRRASDVGLA